MRSAFFAALVAIVAPAATMAADAHGRLKSQVEALRKPLAEKAAKLECPALAVGVVAGDELVMFSGFGARDLDKAKQPPTKDTVFRIGSITKTFTGAALVMLADDGKLWLDDPLLKYAPESATLVLPTRDSPPVSLRHLATHTSGFPRIGSFDYTREDAKITPESVWGALKGLQLESSPGTHESYSNLGASVLGLVLGRVAKMPYRELVTSRITKPLGMSSAAWDRSAVPEDRLATGYEKRDGKFVATPHWPLGASEAAGGLYLSTADLAKWASFQLSAWPPRDDEDKGPIRRSSLRLAQRSAAPLNPGPHQVGIFWQLDQDPVFGTVVWHNGAVGNYRSSLFMLPQKGLAAVALCTNGNEEKLDAFTRELLLDATHADQPELSKALQGAYSQVLAQLEKPDAKAIGKLFGSAFLKSSSAPDMRAFFAGVHDRAGKCGDGELLAGDGQVGGKWRLRCDRGLRDLLIHLDANEGFRIDGLYIKPPADP